MSDPSSAVRAPDQHPMPDLGRASGLIQTPISDVPIGVRISMGSEKRTLQQNRVESSEYSRAHKEAASPSIVQQRRSENPMLQRFPEPRPSISPPCQTARLSGRAP